MEADGDPHRGIAGPPRPQPEGDEQLGGDDQLGRDGVERAVGEHGHDPVGEHRGLDALTRALDAVPRDLAAEPIRVDELAQPRRAVDRRRLEAQQPQRPCRRRRRQRGQPRRRRHHASSDSSRPHGVTARAASTISEVGAVVVQVRRREEHVVGDDGEHDRRRQPRAHTDRHRDRGERPDAQHADVQRPRQLRVPGRVGLVERVPVDPPVPGVEEERAQVEQHDRADQHPQQRHRPHAHAAAEQLVDLHPAPPSGRRCAARRPRGRRCCATSSRRLRGTASRCRAACARRPSRGPRRGTPAGCPGRRRRGGGRTARRVPGPRRARPTGSRPRARRSGRAGRPR